MKEISVFGVFFFFFSLCFYNFSVFRECWPSIYISGGGPLLFHSGSELPCTTAVFCWCNRQPAGNKHVYLTFTFAPIPTVYGRMDIRLRTVGPTEYDIWGVFESPEVTFLFLLKDAICKNVVTKKTRGNQQNMEKLGFWFDLNEVC